MRTPHLAIALLSFSLVLLPAFSAEPEYPLTADSQPQDGIPKGTVTQHEFKSSKIFPGTIRDYWIYVPAQYDKSKPHPITIFQDGGGFASEKGAYRTPTVLDNLIHKKEIPPMIGIFINPGIIPTPGGKTSSPKPDDKSEGENAHPRYNRSYEYDATTDRYARFLLEELFPEVGKSYNLSSKGADRAICGTSSGGSCAFTAAWERPGEFSRVISFIGSFTGLRGANMYPTLIRKTEPKPMRVFLQDGSNDLDIYAGSWWVGNQDMLAALKFAGYEHMWVPGEGAHNPRHAAAVLPDALRFAWKDYPNAPKPGTFNTSAKDTRPTVMSILLPDQGWELLGEGYRFTEGPSADGAGNVYFTDVPADRIHKISPDGKVSVFAEGLGGADGMEFGPDNKLYAALNRKNQIVAIDQSGKAEIIASDIQPNDVVVTHDKHVYVTDHNNRQVWHINPKGEKRVVDKGLNFPNGITLTPDQTQLIVADMRGAGLYIFTRNPDGSLSNKQLYFTAHIPIDRTDSGCDGLTVDSEGRVYAATHMGIQVFDQAGRVNAIIPRPNPAKGLSNMVFGGPNREYLYVTHGDKVYRRKTRAKGIFFFDGPTLPPTPRL